MINYKIIVIIKKPNNVKLILNNNIFEFFNPEYLKYFNFIIIKKFNKKN